MVEVKVELRYKCPYCREVYPTREEAEECASDCVDLDDVIEVSHDVILCEYCHKEYDFHEQAAKCEQQHIERQDKAYENTMRARDMERLKKAASLPGQKKMGGW